MTGSLFRGIIPEKYRDFSGNFRKNSAGKIPPEISELTTLVGVKQSVIVDGTDQWRRRLHACVRDTGDIFNIPRDIN